MAIKTKQDKAIGKEPVVVFPLKAWTAIAEHISELEDSLRFNRAYKESRGKKGLDLDALKKKYALK
ncbi:MAG: hypothetical protein Q7R63_00980 [bacterium]|nr:hypothetical protein [bacterium]